MPVDNESLTTTCHLQLSAPVAELKFLQA